MGNNVEDFFIKIIGVTCFILVPLLFYSIFLVVGTIIVLALIFIVAGVIMYVKDRRKKNSLKIDTESNVYTLKKRVPVEFKRVIVLLPNLMMKNNKLGMINKYGEWQDVFIKSENVSDRGAYDVLLMDMLLQGVMSWRTMKNLATEDIEAKSLRLVLMECNQKYKQQLRSVEYLLKSNFNTLVQVTRNIAKKDTIDDIKIKLDGGYPIMLSIKILETEAILVVGYELDRDKKVKRLYCLSPQNKLPQNKYWNAYIDINNCVKDEYTRYTYMPGKDKVWLGEYLSVVYSDRIINGEIKEKIINK